MIYFYSTSQMKQLSPVNCGANSKAKVEVPLSSEVRNTGLTDVCSSLARCVYTYIITHRSRISISFKYQCNVPHCTVYSHEYAGKTWQQFGWMI